MSLLSKVKALAWLAVALCPFRADAFKLSCRVVDAEGEPQAYATYHICKKSAPSKVMTAGTAGADGDIATNISTPGDYVMKLSYVGAAEKTVEFSAADAVKPVDLGVIAMEKAENTLGEIEVTAQKPLVTKEIDRVGYDVQSDTEAPTSTLSEMLRKVPMVSVDTDGTITINGSSSFQVYKNGRPSKSYSNNAKEIFKAIPASMIKRIEVITEPGARYDAEGVGAILNIVTLDDLVVKGVMGSGGLEFSEKNLIPAANLWLNSQIDKVAFSVYGGYRNFNNKERESESFSDFVYDNGAEVNDYMHSFNKGNMAYYGGEASYELDSLNLFTAEFNGYYYGFSSEGNGWSRMTAPDGSPLYSYNIANRTPVSSYSDLDLSVNYQHLMRNPGEMINVGYQLSTNRESSESSQRFSDMLNMPVDYSGIDANSRLRFMEHTFQFDWEKPFAKIHTLELGAKAIIRRNRSTSRYDYIDSRKEDVEFRHVTDVAAAYAQYSVKLNRVGLRAGLRYEFSYLDSDNKGADTDGYSSKLSDLVPSAAASWQVDDANSLSFNYAARINRPGINYLNPAVYETPSSVSYGNPDLNSAMHHSLKLTYMLIKPKFNMNFSANYELSNNGIAAVKFIDDENRMVSTYSNIGHRRALSFNAFMQWSITRKIKLMANGGLQYTHFSQQNMKLSRWTPFYFVRYSQELPWKINGQLGAFMFCGQPDGVYSYPDPVSFSNSTMWTLSLSRSFLKDDRLNVRVEARNPIGRSSRRWTTVIANGDYTGSSVNTMMRNKGVKLSISYRFGSMNSSVKKTARRINNDDMVGGSSNQTSASE